ncbi:unnamed protein product [Mytilus edulis]|uniref:Fibronectin type-III domain-containing protein n=1 Tax=Mytilus edulis TaxID=6550 RepID=A0A8S3QP03_MYTED|nr:unnamed protein product [Mytilus edulis]
MNKLSTSSVVGGVDIIDNKNVGLTNHVALHDLQLQNGHKYFVTVTAYDFVNRSAEIRSDPITIDTTPPELSSKSITISGRLLTYLTEIEACWEGVFYDVQSGIHYYMWGIGSLPGQDDVTPFSKTLQHRDMSLEDRSYDMIEGYPYFITVKAFNRAHLSVGKSTLAYIYDITPPSTGYVYDGRKDTSTTEKKDIDYQTDMTQLSFFWEGFNDPHSIIKYYSVHIGTCPGCNDVMTQQTVGIHTYFTLSNVNLEAGITYYSTVTACNTGNLCTSATSDGVVIDNSPPVPGIVQDGTDDHDIEYQSARNYLSAKWFGFADAQSEIKYYVIRAGSSPGSADVYPPKMLTLSDLVLLTDLPVLLPFGRRIYLTIRAYNKAGLYSESTSNGFKIDISAPEIVEKPSFSSDLASIVPGSTVLRSALRFRWNVQDTQSSIQRQYLSISSHSNGEFNATSLMVSGVVREYTMTGLDLHDGYTYYMNLIVCNGAQICIETKSDGILVDTSPPTSGMFAVSTYHAVNLQRHAPGWMNWSEYRLNIAVLGFKDFHSGITKYFVSVGNNFMGDNLNKVPGSPMEYFHNDSSLQHLDEGPIQYIILSTQQLKNYDHIYISILAVNKVGLKSPMIHHKFHLIPGGYLDLIRRCTAQTCLGHCVCSPNAKRCHLIGNACTDVSADNKDTLIAVLDTIDLSGPNQDDIQYTPSNSFLSAKWNIVKNQGLLPLWYEWAIGFTSSDLPEHVIDNSIETLWHHSGQIMEATYCLPRGQKLSESITYSVFVRVWYSSSKYAIFKSDGVTVLAQPILIKNQRGSAVVEKIPLFWKSDVDFIKPGYLFTISWKNVFSAKSGSIQKFNVYMSSFKGGADLHKIDLDIESSVNAVNISRLTMVPGVRYFSNVIARSYSGLQTVAYSDGIMVDSSPPVSGVIYNGLGLHNINYQNKSDIVSATWHGFTDTGSGIVRYSWCVGATQNDHDCDILPIKNVGMHTSVSTRIQNPTHNGKVLYSKLKAVDEVGYETDMIISTGVAVDTTPPLPMVFSHSLENLLVNPSFEETNGCSMNIEDVSGYNLCDSNNCYQPLSWIKDNCATTIKSDLNVAFDERSFLYLKGSIQQNIQKLVFDVLYRVSFVTSHTPINGAVISNIEGSLEFCNQEHAFQIFTKDNESDITWHLHTFYFRANSETSELKFSNLNRNVGFILDDVKIQKVEELSNSDDKKAVHIHTVGLHRWTSIHASWNFVDLESPITEYLWAIGNTKGNAEIQHFQSVGVNNFAYNYNVTLIHLSQIFVTVVAVNAAGLRGKAYSTGFDIDLTPPVIAYIHDGAGDDIDGQTSSTISAYWDVTDSESNIHFCEWAVGFQPYGNELQSFKKSTELKSATVTVDEDIISQKTVYSTVRCHNNAGLFSTATSDGVTISEIPPSSENAVITIIPQSITEYSSGDNYQQDKTSVRMKWSGFVDQFGIMSFVVQFDGENIHLKNSVLDINKQVSYMVMTGLDLPASLYTGSVAATGSMYIRSNKVYTNITVNTTKPAVIEGSRVTTIKKDDEITISWSDCFSISDSLVYEVSAGTTQGGADVIQWQETTNTFITLQLTEKLKSNSNLNLFLFIRAIGQNGAYSSIGDDISV